VMANYIPQWPVTCNYELNRPVRIASQPVAEAIKKRDQPFALDKLSDVKQPTNLTLTRDRIDRHRPGCVAGIRNPEDALSRNAKFLHVPRSALSVYEYCICGFEHPVPQ